VFSDDLIQPWLERLREDLGELELFDCHTHIGSNDPDGFACEAHELLAALALAGSRAAVFPMHEPDGYPPANDVVIEHAQRSDGRLTAFCRLDPNDEPLAELERCLAAGARGIKLHTRAEPVELAGDELRDCFELADERNLPVLVHAGRGIPALGRQALAVCARHPGLRLILAHAGISDLAWIWREAPDHPNLFFDTSWWAPSDLLALLALVPPGQVLLGSDAPYGTPMFGAVMTLRYALQAGLSPDQARSIAGAQMERLVSGAEPVDAGPAPGPGALRLDPLLDRVHTFLLVAIGRMLGGGDDGEEPRSLARLACDVPDDSPWAEVCHSILALLDDLDRLAPKEPVTGRFYPGVQLVILAAAVARTPDVALPGTSGRSR